MWRRVVLVVRHAICSACCLHQAGFLLGVLFDPEDRGGMFFRKITWLYIPEERSLDCHLKFSQSVYAFHTLCMRATFLAHNIALVTFGKEKYASFQSLQLKRCLQTTKISSVKRHLTTNSTCRVVCAQVIDMCELSKRRLFTASVYATSSWLHNSWLLLCDVRALNGAYGSNSAQQEETSSRSILVAVNIVHLFYSIEEFII